MNEPKKSKAFIFKTIFELIIAGILFIIMAVPFVAGLLIKAQINKSAYIKADRCLIEIFNPAIVVKGIQFYKLPLKNHFTLSGTSRYVQIKNISLIDLISRKELKGCDLEIGRAQLTMESDSSQEQQTSGESALKITSIQKLEIKKSSLNLTDSSGAIYEIAGLEGSVSPLSHFIEKTPGDLKINFSIEGTSYKTANGLYAISTNRIQALSDYKVLMIDSLKVNPLYKEREFTKHLKYQTDRFDFSCPHIVMNLLSIEEPYHVSTVILTDPSLKVFRDKIKARNPKAEFASLQHYLMQSPIDYTIDSLLISGGFIQYREHLDESFGIGEIELPDATIAIARIKKDGIKGDSLTISMKSRFMKSGKLEAALSFPYATHSFICAGELKSLPITEINKISYSSAGMLFSDGVIHSCKFNFTADDIARGDLSLKYSKLEFKVADKSDGKTTGLMSRIKSALASVILPKGKGETDEVSKQGAICYARRSDRFVINYIWRSILSGLQSAMSLPDFDKTADSKSPC